MKKLCYLSKNTKRIFSTFEEAYEDASLYASVILLRKVRRSDIILVFNYLK